MAQKRNLTFFLSSVRMVICCIQYIFSCISYANGRNMSYPTEPASLYSDGDMYGIIVTVFGFLGTSSKIYHKNIHSIVMYIMHFLHNMMIIYVQGYQVFIFQLFSHQSCRKGLALYYITTYCSINCACAPYSVWAK